MALPGQRKVAFGFEKASLSVVLILSADPQKA